MRLKIKLKQSNTYSDIIRCPIALGLRDRGIIALVGGNKWCGLFMFVIPVWGSIPEIVNKEAMNAYFKWPIDTQSDYFIGLYD